MTSEEIKAAPESSKTDAGWLKEIAYQLALLNERPEESKPIIAELPIKRGPGRPPKTA